MNDRQRDPMEECLYIWATSYRRDDRDLGCRTSRYGSDTSQNPFEDDERIAKAVDAMMESLIERHIWAIKKKFGVSGVWRFPHADLAESYAEAVAALEPLLRKNIATGAKFE